MTIRRKLLQLGATLPLFLAVACAHAEEITVSAAASLTNALTDIGKQFEASHPGTKVSFNFGPSGGLLQQIVRGAPVDAFVSADTATMDRAAQAQVIDPATRADIASNTLVLIVPARSTLQLKSIEDLTQPAVAHIAMGNPETTPAGTYAQATLSAAKLWPAIQPKIILAGNVRQSLTYVSRNEVEAGFVFATDAALDPDKVRVAFAVPVAKPILYPAARVIHTAHGALAGSFIDYLRAAPSAAILQRYGFSKP